MDEYEIEVMADKLFEPFDEYAYGLTLDDALSLAEEMESKFSMYADGIRADLRNLR